MRDPRREKQAKKAVRSHLYMGTMIVWLDFIGPHKICANEGLKLWCKFWRDGHISKRLLTKLKNCISQSFIEVFRVNFAPGCAKATVTIMTSQLDMCTSPMWAAARPASMHDPPTKTGQPEVQNRCWLYSLSAENALIKRSHSNASQKSQGSDSWARPDTCRGLGKKPSRILWMFTKSTTSSPGKADQHVQKEMQKSCAHQDLAPLPWMKCRQAPWKVCTSQSSRAIILEPSSRECFARRTAAGADDTAWLDVLGPEVVRSGRH